MFGQIAKLKVTLLLPMVLWIFASQSVLHIHETIPDLSLSADGQFENIDHQESNLKATVCPFCLHTRNPFLVSAIENFSGIHFYTVVKHSWLSTPEINHFVYYIGNRSPPFRR